MVALWGSPAELVAAELVAAAPVMHKTLSGLTYSHCHPLEGVSAFDVSLSYFISYAFFSCTKKKLRF